MPHSQTLRLRTYLFIIITRSLSLNLALFVLPWSYTHMWANLLQTLWHIFFVLHAPRMERQLRQAFRAQRARQLLRAR